VAEEKTKEEKKTTKKARPNQKAEKKGAKQTNPVARYLRETRGELRKVTWPTRSESWRLTAIVIAVSTVMAVFLWFWDLIFSQSIQWLIEAIAA